MKPQIHPDYRPVMFRDKSADFAFLTRSTETATATAQITWTDGQTYSVIDVEVFSQSHPFYTGRSRLLDAAGQVEKFQRRYGHSPHTNARPPATVPTRGPATPPTPPQPRRPTTITCCWSRSVAASGAAPSALCRTTGHPRHPVAARLSAKPSAAHDAPS